MKSITIQKLFVALYAYLTSIQSLWIITWKRPRLIEAIATISLSAKLAKLEFLKRRDLIEARVAHKGHTSALSLLHHLYLLFLRGHKRFLLQLEYLIIGVEQAPVLAILLKKNF